MSELPKKKMSKVSVLGATEISPTQLPVFLIPSTKDFELEATDQELIEHIQELEAANERLMYMVKELTAVNQDLMNRLENQQPASYPEQIDRTYDRPVPKKEFGIGFKMDQRTGEVGLDIKYRKY